LRLKCSQQLHEFCAGLQKSLMIRSKMSLIKVAGWRFQYP
jgi:hypothetical protein